MSKEKEMNQQARQANQSVSPTQILARQGLTTGSLKEAMSNSVRIDAAVQSGQELAWIAFDAEELRELFNRCLHSHEEDNLASKEALLKLAHAVDRLDVGQPVGLRSHQAAEAL